MLNEESLKYEISFHMEKMVKFEVDDSTKDERIVYIAQKVYIPPNRTFFQKYGSYFIIGLSLVIQVSFL